MPGRAAARHARLWLAAVLCVLAPCVIAADAPVRRVGPAVATGTCVGEASSAVCAVDTLLACIARADPMLCRRVGAEPPEPPPPPRLLIYVIERSGVIRREHVGEDMRDLAWFKAGHTLVELRMRACAPGQATCPEDGWEDVQVYLRRQANLWQILHWHMPGDPDTAPQIPESFVPRAP